MCQSHLDEVSLAGTAQRLGLNSPYARSGFSGFDDDGEASIGGGVWVESDSLNDENSLSKGKGRMYTGFDFKGTPHRRYADFLSGEPESVSNGAYRSAALELPNLNTGMTMPPPPLPPKKVSKFAKVPVGWI